MKSTPIIPRRPSAAREKVTPEEKAMAAKGCAEGRLSQTEAARRLGVAESTVSEWVQWYKANGASAFQKQEHNAVYSDELKLKVVEEYLSEAGSLREIAAKYSLRSNSQLRDWIKQYSSTCQWCKSDQENESNTWILIPTIRLLLSFSHPDNARHTNS